MACVRFVLLALLGGVDFNAEYKNTCVVYQAWY